MKGKKFHYKNKYIKYLRNDMIIDEGFLSNAKKIASTQPQQSEVRAPVIKRENYEYHIEITFDVLYSKKFSKYILSCDIFKEKGNIDFDSSENKLTLDADMFITVDTVYKFLYCLNRCAKTLDITGEKEISIDCRNHQIRIAFITNDYVKLMYKDFEKFGIGRNILMRYMLRNSIIVIFDHYSDYIYPFRINYDDMLNIIKRQETDLRTDVSIYKASDLSRLHNYKVAYILEERKYIEIFESLKNYSQCEYIISSGLDSAIFISTAYPVIYEGEYVYIVFESRFADIESIIDDNIKKSLKVNSDIYDIDFIDYRKCIDEYENYKSMRYSVSIYVNNYESSSMKDIMFKCDLFRKYRIMKEDEGDDNTVTTFDAEIDMTVDNVYQLMTEIIKTNNFSHTGKIKITDRKTGNVREGILPECIYECIDKNYVSDSESLFDFEDLMNGLICDYNRIHEWENKNNIVYTNDTYNGSSIITGALYIDVPSKIFDIIEGKYETYILDARREKSYDITDEKLFGILESNEIHKYIIDFIEDGKNIKIMIYPMYSVLLGKEYVYPCIKSELSNKNNYTKKELYINIYNNIYIFGKRTKVSDIKLCNIDNVKEKIL
jgi:hypothetical protein